MTNQHSKCDDCYRYHLPEHHDNERSVSDICENCQTNEVWHYNETVRDRNTKIAKIMNICLPCFTKITGAK